MRMPSFEEHIAMDLKLTGIAFPEVHREMDANFANGSYAHRRTTHYFEYVLERIANKHWTIEQAVSAIHHIIYDCGCLMLKSDWSDAEELISYERTKTEKEEDSNQG